MALITDMNGATRTLQATPQFHVGGIAWPYATWWMGGTTVLLRSFDALQVLQTIEKERITFTFMVAAMVQGVLAVPGVEKFDLSSMRRIVSAAAKSVRRRWRQTSAHTALMTSRTTALRQIARLCPCDGAKPTANAARSSEPSDATTKSRSWN